MIDMDSLPWHKRLLLLRTLKSWSQNEAAKRCGTNQKVFWLWESGKSYPRQNSRKAIAAAFGVKEEDIFKTA